MEGRIVWDVIEEHLDEATYLYGEWRRAFDSPLYTLGELARGLEERFFAHWDGLVVGGAPVAEQLLMPLLGGEQEAEAERLVVAALALLDQGRGKAVVKALRSELEPIRHACQQALVLNGGPAFDDWLRARWAAGLDEVRRRVLTPVAAGRGLVVDNWAEALSSSDDDEAAAAAVGACSSDARRHLPLVERLFSRAAPAVRDAALGTALAWGSVHAWKRCLELATESVQPEPLAMTLMAMLGDAACHEQLLAQLEQPSHRRAVLAALAFSGSAAVAAALVPWLEVKDPLDAKLAAQAISVIAGLRTTAEPFISPEPPEPQGTLPPLEEDDLAASLVPPAESALPMPNAPAIQAWCAEHLPRLTPGARWLLGELWTPASAKAFMLTAPLSRRHAMALWLGIASGGRVRIDTRAFTIVQREQLAAASSWSDMRALETLGGWKEASCGPSRTARLTPPSAPG
jgi:uncharacterized protein (TIGR02270 family)